MSRGPSEYEAYLTTLGIRTEALAVDSRGTIVGSSPQAAARPRLPVLRLHDTAEAPADVRVTRLLGEGGMGQVVAAEQVAIGREVAVKVAHRGADPRATDALLREALIAGRLEHPNVVPVYLLGCSDAGDPVFVMRRVEGVAWSQVLRDPSSAPGMFSGVGEPLEFHLGVFMEVCGAVQFAHSRGIIHRDLKPDNVMLGAWREVYVVDWGLAVSLGDNPQLPRAAEARGVVGTPAYIAPEMAAADAAALGPRTDVYLLGAVLYHVLTGAPPHAEGTLVQRLAHAWLGLEPKYPESLPPDLVAVCRRAMARAPAERFASPDELRRAVAECVRHRSSWALSAEADRRARSLAEAIVAAGDAPVGALAASVHEAFTECRFGYRQALSEWPGNAAALEGLQRVLEAMIEYELLRDNVRAAAELLMQLPRPAEALARRVTAARGASDARAARLLALERFHHDADETFGAASRNRMGALIGGSWGVASFVVGWGERTGRWHFGCGAAVVAATAFAANCTAIVVWLRRRAPMNAIQRRFTTVITLCAWGMINHWGLCFALDVSLQVALALYLLWASGGWLMAAIFYDRRVFGGALALALGALAVALAPGVKFEALGVTVLCTYGALLFPPRWLDAEALLARIEGRDPPAGTPRGAGG